MRRTLRPLGRGDRGDRGSTLAELTVAMLVFGIFGTMMATTFAQVTRMTRDSAVRESTAQQASLLMQQVTKDLRTAIPVGATAMTQTAFTVAEPGTVQFFSSVTPAVVRERLFVRDGELIRETWRPDAGTAYPALTYTDSTRRSEDRIVPPGMTATTTFSYHLGEAPAVDSTTEVQRITAVHVRVSVDGDGAGGPLRPVVLESTVRPYNR